MKSIQTGRIFFVGFAALGFAGFCPMNVQAQDTAQKDFIYYKGDVGEICRGADKQQETLVESKDFCEAYPIYCLGNQVVCLNGMPASALHSQAREEVYQKNLPSYTQNQKTICKDFPWTCPGDPQVLAEVEKYENDENYNISILKPFLPPKYTICEDEEDCREGEACAQNNVITTGSLSICKKIVSAKCKVDTDCPNMMYCSAGKCVDCINGMVRTVKVSCRRHGVRCGYYVQECFHHKWGTSTQFFGTAAPPDSSDDDEIYDKITPWGQNSCKSNLDCKDIEVCNSYYGKCLELENDEDDVPPGSRIASILKLPLGAEATKEKNELITFYKYIMKNLNNQKLIQSDDVDDKTLETLLTENKASLNYYLGLIYLKGTTRNLKTAFGHIKSAADAGRKDAQFILGLMYLYGQGTIQDENKGFWFLTHVFKPQSHTATPPVVFKGALLELIKCYRYGLGIPRDLNKVRELTEIAESLEGPDAEEIQEFYAKLSIDRFCEFEDLILPDKDGETEKSAEPRSLRDYSRDLGFYFPW